MKALVKTGPKEEDLELKLDWPEAEPDPDQVKLRIAAAGICGTDIHILRGTWRCDYPVVIGHEFCGTVIEVGSRVRGFKVGDRVVAANPAKTCGHCRHCISGNAFMCPERVSAGYMIDGAFAETLCIDADPLSPSARPRLVQGRRVGRTDLRGRACRDRAHERPCRRLCVRLRARLRWAARLAGRQARRRERDPGRHVTRPQPPRVRPQPRHRTHHRRLPGRPRSKR